MSCKYLYFTEKDLQQRWNEVKSEEEFWSQVTFRMKKMTKILLEATLREERQAYVNAGRYERTEGRTDHRNGTYERDLLTTLGWITDIRVPRCRRRGFRSKIIQRYTRKQEKVTEALKEMCVVAVSRKRPCHLRTKSASSLQYD